MSRKNKVSSGSHLEMGDIRISLCSGETLVPFHPGLQERPGHRCWAEFSAGFPRGFCTLLSLQVDDYEAPSTLLL